MQCSAIKAACHLANDQLALARTLAHEALDIALRRGQPGWAAVAMEHLASVSAQTGDPTRAARIIGYVDKLCALGQSAREYSENAGYERTMARLRSIHSPDVLASLLADGAALSESTAATEALAIVSDVRWMSPTA